MGHRVIAPLVQARRADGGYVHVYEGGTLPSDTDPAQLEQLLDSGMVAEVDDEAGGGSDLADDPIVAFLDRTAKEVIDDAPSLTDEDRAAAITAEENGKNRSTVLEALTEAGGGSDPADDQ